MANDLDIHWNSVNNKLDDIVKNCDPAADGRTYLTHYKRS